uniref:Uncharacterized protein n=1 Tax=Lygus hesperus TaxID=30085 RepID=A0A0A9XPH6_LYGHE
MQSMMSVSFDEVVTRLDRSGPVRSFCLTELVQSVLCGVNGAFLLHDCTSSFTVIPVLRKVMTVLINNLALSSSACSSSSSSSPLTGESCANTSSNVPCSSANADSFMSAVPLSNKSMRREVFLTMYSVSDIGVQHSTNVGKTIEVSTPCRLCESLGFGPVMDMTPYFTKMTTVKAKTQDT